MKTKRSRRMRPSTPRAAGDASAARRRPGERAQAAAAPAGRATPSWPAAAIRASRHLGEAAPFGTGRYCTWSASTRPSCVSAMWRMRTVEPSWASVLGEVRVLGAHGALLAHHGVGLQGLLHDGEAQRHAPDGEHGEADDEDDEDAREAGALRRRGAASAAPAARPAAPDALRLLLVGAGPLPRAAPVRLPPSCPPRA